MILYITMSYMISVTFSELRNSAKKYFDKVEKGESLEVFRNGKPIALIVPKNKSSLKRWKTSNPLMIKGVSLSQYILDEREE